MAATLSRLPAVVTSFLPSHSTEESPAASSCASDSRSASPTASEASSSSQASSARTEALNVWSRTWTTVSAEKFTAPALSALYDAKADNGVLGVICCAENEEAAEELSADIVAKGLGSYISTTPSEAAAQLAISVAGLRSIISFLSPSGTQTFHLLERPRVAFPPASHTPCFPATGSALLSPATALGNIPNEDEWAALWRAWDAVTLEMIPSEMLHQKPIDLRHKCLFYIGHIPTFLDMLLNKAVGGGPSEPAYFWNIFERGIDPHVDDPDHCHNHSEVPERDEDWPTIETIMAFRDRVRARLMRLYADLRAGRVTLTRNIARTLAYTLEHEGFHVETLLYMLIQRAGTGTLPPPGFTAPPWELLKAQWDATPAPATLTVALGPAEVTLGHEDAEGEDFLPAHAGQDLADHEFGWDNESPARRVSVGAFRAEWRPVTNGEFEAYWRAARGEVPMPMSWVEEDGEIKVRTMYGPVPFDVARHWPVLTAYDDMRAFAASKGGRLPTEPELRLFLDTYDVGHEGGANVGFRNWHPVCATAGLEGGSNGGRGSNGGVWEWTSTQFDTHEGITPTKLFPGYSTDFFDTKHQVALGASYATIPRLGRRTVRNFYQHNYPYPWVAARVVYDA
ncbi:C-type lectin protein [Schizophyllum amplum]|uniref:C-type lectin protein n=1 Tax=Schizophyllum amplum TaxID=97359 RepID=A0A550CWP7_9AGAR|nr:C-type lectin protein [Auriculariopsis ampla]